MDDNPALPSAAASRCIRFGRFEVDLSSGELRKNGARVRIQEQPFQILLLLLERPGEVIRRDELRQRLWSTDTFVDFDHGLNTAINKLREALGDAANNPRFVETVARRGYRFIAPMEQTSRQSLVASRQPEAEGRATALPLQGKPQASVDSTQAGGLPRPARALTRTLLAFVQLMYLAFYTAALIRLDNIHQTVADLRAEWALAVMILVLVTGAAGIALRLYLLAAVSFDYQPLGKNFRRLFPVLLPLDQLWALSPFLLLPQIGIGAAFAACAALLYLPFSQRTLIRMAYQYENL